MRRWWIQQYTKVLDNGVPDNNCNAFVMREDFQPHEAGRCHAQKWTQGPPLVRVKLKILSISHLSVRGSACPFNQFDVTVKTRERAKDLNLCTIIFSLSCQCLRYIYCDHSEVAERMSVKHIKSVKGKQNIRRRSNIPKVVLVFFLINTKFHINNIPFNLLKLKSSLSSIRTLNVVVIMWLIMHGWATVKANSGCTTQQQGGKTKEKPWNHQSQCKHVCHYCTDTQQQSRTWSLSSQRHIREN